MHSLLDGLRLIKSPFEVEQLQTAADISSAAFRVAMAATHPGFMEAQLDATLEYECRMRGASFLAYPPVVAGGERALTLHYIENSQALVDGELVLVDAGCEFRHYASDISRTWPVNGRFSGPQRELYEVVLAVQEICIAAAHVDGNMSLTALNKLAMSTLHKLLSSLVRFWTNPNVRRDARIEQNLRHWQKEAETPIACFLINLGGLDAEGNK